MHSYAGFHLRLPWGKKLSPDLCHPDLTCYLIQIIPIILNLVCRFILWIVKTLFYWIQLPLPTWSITRTSLSPLSPSIVFPSTLPDLTLVLTIFRFHSKTSLLSRLCVTTIASFQRNRNLMKHTSTPESLINEKSWNLLQLKWTHNLPSLFIGYSIFITHNW